MKEKAFPKERNRPAQEPGGCECSTCGVIFIGAEWHTECAVCWAKRHGDKNLTRRASNER